MEIRPTNPRKRLSPEIPEKPKAPVPGNPRKPSVSPEHVSGIYPVLYIIQTGIITVGNDGIRRSLKPVQIVYHKGTEEGAALFQ